MDLFSADDAATALTEEEKEGLVPSWISLRSELNSVEQEGILAAEKWAFARRRNDILSESFLRRLHKQMFKAVWKWAGQFRNTERNIGVVSWNIPSALRVLLEDVNYWITHGTYSSDEIAARFHHRLVWIHPFPNGNGRHARLMTDLLLIQMMGQPRFSWGSVNLMTTSMTRTQYVAALRAADGQNYGPLLAFVRS